MLSVVGDSVTRCAGPALCMQCVYIIQNYQTSGTPAPKMTRILRGTISPSLPLCGLWAGLPGSGKRLEEWTAEWTAEYKAG